MDFKTAKEIIDYCKEHGVTRVKLGDFEAEILAQRKEAAPLDAVALAKALSDSMPPDSAMQFAAVDDPNPELPKPEVPSE